MELKLVYTQQMMYWLWAVEGYKWVKSHQTLILERKKEGRNQAKDKGLLCY